MRKPGARHVKLSANHSGSTSEEYTGARIEHLIPEFSFTGEVTEVASNEAAVR